jgi:signal transduction histidine kinase
MPREQRAKGEQEAGLGQEAQHHTATSRRHIQRRWLSRLADSMAARMPLPDLLRLLREGVIESCGFDRVGIFLYDASTHTLQGVWGTDRQGHPISIEDLVLPVPTDEPQYIVRLIRGEMAYYLVPDHSQRQGLLPDDPMYGVGAHAQISMRCNGEVVGLVCVDNLLSDHPITEEDIEELMVFAEQGALAVHSTRLLDEVKQTQAILVRAEKLRAVGELASGVAHNVNNVLAAVQGYAELIQDAPTATAELRHYARIIERAVQDGAAMVQRIQRFARTESLEDAVPFEFARIAREAIDLTRPAWHSQALAQGLKIEIVTDMAPGVRAIGVASEIREVLVNLIKNAADAMPSGGILTVSCYVDGDDGVFAVTDTGIGMSAETQRHIFEPFFSTKDDMRGTGLGLAVAWGIIQRHGGGIDVQSAPGKGTTIEVHLPFSREPAVHEAICTRDGALDGLRVLVVEDEELVAGGIGRILMAHGAAPYLAQDAKEALDWLARNADACDLVLSDHGMIGCTGLQLLERVRELYPHLRRVLLSGWGAMLPNVQDTSAAELLLSKPIRQEQLVDALLSLRSGSSE